MSMDKMCEKTKTPFADSDVLIRAQVPRAEIQMLVKFVEGLGHLGVVTTTDRHAGEVLIQTTQYTWPDLKMALEAMPIEINIKT
ncbi:hypothetical protein Desdi_2477 [Desulfitobacterium dichloroeliminans LMG P-21439]|uniref:DUF4911 domain-containing protein n=1 Tax=Desulfitobacterium dichloroeliminans (strain LMG P-21439 / DCA1) TaxID=871963 RepID=L0FB68_DESDL|nr:DUF4911 domain-containing protein [Desulfitobacterium dichloroeliminans]AGA69901.1 hypothetical protein Desdi_2477 [Desulfitobacterium dichloroeliminans LMG P-21439]